MRSRLGAILFASAFMAFIVPGEAVALTAYGDANKTLTTGMWGLTGNNQLTHCDSHMTNKTTITGNTATIDYGSDLGFCITPMGLLSADSRLDRVVLNSNGQPTLVRVRNDDVPGVCEPCATEQWVLSENIASDLEAGTYLHQIHLILWLPNSPNDKDPWVIFDPRCKPGPPVGALGDGKVLQCDFQQEIVLSAP